MTSSPAVLLKPHRHTSLLAGHPWIFSGGIMSVEGATNGDVVRIHDAHHAFLGVGYYNGASGIAVRVLSREDRSIDTAFFVEKISALRTMKERFISMQDTNAYRVVHSESDGIPGLVVDRFNDVLVVQSYTAGIDALKPLIIEALQQVFAPRTIYERSDLSIRELEGLSTRPTGYLAGDTSISEAEITEHGVKYVVNFVTGQKTGFFLDQRENRAAVASYASGKRCLNVFSYTGGFSVAARAAGAVSCINVDSSEPALRTAEANYALNGMTPTEGEFVASDAFDYLRDRAEEPAAFDLIILDPPAFAKSHKEKVNALKAYTKLNALALRSLKPGGILVTSSCSGSVSEAEFFDAVRFAAERANTSLRLLEKRAQPIDHGINTAFPEGEYLKFFIFVKA